MPKIKFVKQKTLLPLLLALHGSWLSTTDIVNTKIFNHIDVLHKFVSSNKEFPPVDNDNWYDPDYTSFHKKTAPSFMLRLACAMGLTKPMWDPRLFENLIAEVADLRELDGMMGRFIEKITPLGDCKFVIIGTLNGALHSFLRCLDDLIERQLLDEHLMIRNPNTYIVINGNVVNGSPYIIETLTLILVLMKKNPHNVFYIRGHLEDRGYWKEEGLSRELAIKADSTTYENSSLSDLIKRFFNTLPLALYIVGKAPDGTNNMIRISPIGTESKELDEDSFSTFFNDDQKEISMFKLNRKKTKRAITPLKVIIKNEPLGLGYNNTEGLRVASKEKGVFVWTILSGPVDVKRRLFKFSYDAFTVLSTPRQPNPWTIRVCNKDIRDFGKIKCGPTFNVFTGIETQYQESASQETQFSECICPKEETLKKEIEKIELEIKQFKQERVCKEPFDQKKSEDKQEPTQKSKAKSDEKKKADKKN